MSINTKRSIASINITTDETDHLSAAMKITVAIARRMTITKVKTTTDIGISDRAPRQTMSAIVDVNVAKTAAVRMIDAKNVM